MDEQCQQKVLLFTILMSSFNPWLQYIAVVCTQHRIRQWRLALNAFGQNSKVLGLQNMREIIQQQRYKHRKPRRFWQRPGRTSAWWKNFLDEKVVAEEWYENFRLLAFTCTLCSTLQCKELPAKSRSLSKESRCHHNREVM